MAFKVVATPFRQRLSTGYPHEHEALRPLGVEITTITASTDDEWIAQARDADAVIVGGRRLTADLIRALDEGKLAGAGLDVMDVEPLPTDSRLAGMENVILTPHSANVSDRGDVERRRRVGQEIAAVLQGRMPCNVANRDVLKKVNLAEPVKA
jgi:D-isomer specific 2-hydroxyacid dehydrogenase, NAD binding domain